MRRSSSFAAWDAQHGLLPAGGSGTVRSQRRIRGAAAGVLTGVADWTAAGAQPFGLTLYVQSKLRGGNAYRHFGGGEQCRMLQVARYISVADSQRAIGRLR
ncbi:hypothetical protein SPI_05890 [Niveomyces insectorum RCEF 264]|uniref:Uncharacterized protein n=1 Tax=Niveomyces insectorum RCEF 264 TaxID=1081102 RepID=A0A167SK11_9HYPO|nr:hypothetical protein SPI_05890 [Niveomyces insectorum RCEF 264]